MVTSHTKDITNTTNLENLHVKLPALVAATLVGWAYKLAVINLSQQQVHSRLDRHLLTLRQLQDRLAAVRGARDLIECNAADRSGLPPVATNASRATATTIATTATAAKNRWASTPSRVFAARVNPIQDAIKCDNQERARRVRLARGNPSPVAFGRSTRK